MMWMEIIQLRMTGNRNLELEVTPMIQAMKNYQDEQTRLVKLFRHKSIEGDWCLILQLESKNVDSTPSNLGLHLATSLREFGRVDHSVWSEM